MLKVEGEYEDKVLYKELSTTRVSNLSGHNLAQTVLRGISWRFQQDFLEIESSSKSVELYVPIKTVLHRVLGYWLTFQGSNLGRLD
jgi:hypothetical protein